MLIIKTGYLILQKLLYASYLKEGLMVGVRDVQVGPIIGNHS